MNWWKRATLRSNLALTEEGKDVLQSDSLMRIWNSLPRMRKKEEKVEGKQWKEDVCNNKLRIKSPIFHLLCDKRLFTLCQCRKLSNKATESTKGSKKRDDQNEESVKFCQMKQKKKTHFIARSDYVMLNFVDKCPEKQKGEKRPVLSFVKYLSVLVSWHSVSTRNKQGWVAPTHQERRREHIGRKRNEDGCIIMYGSANKRHNIDIQ